MCKSIFAIKIIIFAMSVLVTVSVWAGVTFKAGHKSLAQWKLPEVEAPKDNKLTAKRIELGKMLFFENRLSGDGNMSCASCHNPLYGWSDGLATAKGFKSKVLGRASPTIINTAYNPLQMWDGRMKTLEDQALGPMMSPDEMHTDLNLALSFLSSNPWYSKAFKSAYPKEEINASTLAKAIASFERTVVSNSSPFDKWIDGDKKAMSKKQIEGFKIFLDPEKGNCEVCHSAPNFTDNGFHNVGLASYGGDKPDMGRFAIKPIGVLKGAFKTPTLRDVEYTAPYFHDGSAASLKAVVEHYNRGGDTAKDLSPNMKKLSLSQEEIDALVQFMHSLSSPRKPFVLPILPKT